MRRGRLGGLTILAGLMMAWLLLRPLPAQAQSVAEQWRMVELAFTSTRQYANPFLDVQITATFTAPSGAQIIRPGFWDGGDTWKVRVALTEVGQWTYQVSATDPTNAGLNPPPGTLSCVAYTGPLPIYQHGFLRVSATGRYLEHADGTPFFWLGDTHWFFDSRESWDSSDDPRWPSQFRGMVDRRVAQGYSVYQTTLFSPHPDYWAVGQLGERISPDYFREQLDRKMQYLADQGLVNAFGLGFHSNIDNNVTLTTRLAQYMVARYGAYPIVWITAGEVAGYEPALRQARIDGWRQVALEIDRSDGYHQPQTAHYTHDFPSYYQGEDWLDFTMIQGAHDRVSDPNWYGRYLQQWPGVPVIEGEVNYEQIYAHITDAVVRHSAYTAIQSGSFGFTYGAQGIWNAANAVSDPSSHEPNYGRALWNEAIDFPGGQQMSYLRAFYTALPWHTLEARSGEVWATWTLSQTASSSPMLSADDAANNLVIYFPAGYDPHQLSGTLVNLPNRVYSIRWYNPRTGGWRMVGQAQTELNQWQIEPKPDGDDWLLWLRTVASAKSSEALAAVRALPNLAQHRFYRASSEAADDHTVVAAFDGDSATTWQPVAGRPYESHWLEIDFGRPRLINTLVISEIGHHTRGYQIYLWNGEVYQPIASGGLLGGPEPSLIRFPAVGGQRLRLTFTAGIGSPELRDIEIYYEPNQGCGNNPNRSAPGWAENHRCPK